MRAWLVPFFILSSSFFIAFYGPTGRDDVYKTLWPAKTFADAGRIVNYNGDPIEQSSSLLHVVVLGGLHRITGIDLPDLNFGFIVVCGVACMLMGMSLGRRLGIRQSWLLALALSGQAVFVYWALGGLDSVLAALCWLVFVGAGAGFLEKQSLWRGLGMLGACALVVMVRPEGAWVGVGGVMGMAVVRFLTGRRLSAQSGKGIAIQSLDWTAMLGLLALAAIAVAAWRLWHSGHWLPQPVIAKAGGYGLAKFMNGLKYLFWETWRHPELAVVWMGLVWGIVRFIRTAANGSSLHALSLSIPLTGLAFVVLSGGDWMENGRFIVPFMPLLVLVTVVELESMPRKWGRWLQYGWLALCGLGLFWTARHHSTGYSPVLMQEQAHWKPQAGVPFTEQYNRVHWRDIPAVAALQQAVYARYSQTGKPVTVLSQQAGMMAYHLAEEQFGKFRFIDLVGLCTADFTECNVTQGRGNYRGGLNMDLIYFFDDLERLTTECGITAPDIVFGLDDPEGTLRKHLEAQGYNAVFLQEGTLPYGSSPFPGLEMEADEFIVVRE